jgi:hypothetical protein
MHTAIDPRALDDLQELMVNLERSNIGVTLEMPNPHRSSVQNSLESVGIFIVGGAGTALATLVVNDVYNGTKRWLTNRFNKNQNSGPIYVTIYVESKPSRNILARSADHIVDMTPQRREDQ